tara:strand:- start:2608 stop:3060 length:453 start_codon:yes stop_codon:yes gene_type:complete
LVVEVVFFDVDVDDASANVREAMVQKKLPTTRARGKRRERGRRDRARGETMREMRARRNDGCGGNRVAFFLADVSAARSGGARWRDSRFLDLFFVVVVFELSLSESDDDDERVLLCPFRARNKTDRRKCPSSSSSSRREQPSGRRNEPAD